VTFPTISNMSRFHWKNTDIKIHFTSGELRSPASQRKDPEWFRDDWEEVGAQWIYFREKNTISALHNHPLAAISDRKAEKFVDDDHRLHFRALICYLYLTGEHVPQSRYAAKGPQKCESSGHKICPLALYNAEGKHVGRVTVPQFIVVDGVRIQVEFVRLSRTYSPEEYISKRPYPYPIDYDEFEPVYELWDGRDPDALVALCEDPYPTRNRMREEIIEFDTDEYNGPMP
jgi:hypothetical protein